MTTESHMLNDGQELAGVSGYISGAHQGIIANGSEPDILVAVLFARSDSIYKTLPNVDVYDAERDALNWLGGSPVVAHPPCRAWGRLRHFARPLKGERELAPWAVEQVRRWGGVLEHPAASLLWKEASLPQPGRRDSFNGWTLAVPQWWWGHRADKPTLLYICGCEPDVLPEIPFRMGESECVIRLDKRRADGTHIRKGDKDWRQPLGPNEREGTPLEFAKWLLKVARATRTGAVAPALLRYNDGVERQP